MRSIAFPKMLDQKSTLLVDDEEATKNNIALILQTKVNEFFGDPEYGADLVSDLYQFNTDLLAEIVKDQIKTTIEKYIPQAKLDMKDITFTRTRLSLDIHIKVYNSLTKNDNMYEVSLITKE